MSKPISSESDTATPAMLEDNLLPLSLPAVERKKVTAAFGRRFATWIGDGCATREIADLRVHGTTGETPRRCAGSERIAPSR
jgi:hypothetical protein